LGAEFAADGLLGLAFPSLSLFHGQSPLLHTLYNEGKLSQPIFSLKLTDSGGELYVGGTNEALYAQSTLVFAPVIIPAVSANARRYECILRVPFQAYWHLRIENIKVNGAIVLKNVPVVIDTGAHFIIGDNRRLNKLHRAAGGGPYRGRGAYTGQYLGYYNCEFRLILVLSIDSL
jgi:cathepsin D